MGILDTQFHLGDQDIGIKSKYAVKLDYAEI